MMGNGIDTSSNDFLTSVIDGLPAMVQILEVDEINRSLPIWITKNYSEITGIEVEDRLKLGFIHPQDIYGIKDFDDVILATKRLLGSEGHEIGLVCRVNIYPASNWMYIRLKRIHLLEDKRHVICLAFAIDKNFLVNNKKLDESISELKREQNNVDLDVLTKSELIVLKLLLQGLSPKDVAVALCRSFDTVNNHKRSIFKKLKVHKMAELVLFSKEYGFLLD